jgi:ribosomal protein S18 acetylase RimI-like enzyme
MRNILIFSPLSSTLKSRFMIKIFKATEKDLQTIHDMAQVVFRHTYRDILSPEQMEYMMDMMYSMPNLHKQLDEGHHYYIAYMSPAPVIGTDHEDGAPCGYVSVQYEGPDADGIEIFHLHKIYVMPDAQGRGVGLKLFQTVVDHVRGRLSESDIASTPSFTVNPSPFATSSSLFTASPALLAAGTTDLSPAPEPAPLSCKARIELNVNKFNSAVNFYKHLGMRVLLEEDFPIGNGFYKTDYIMGLDV